VVSTLIFYHKNCLDGFGSAWVAWKKFKDQAEYFGINYQKGIPKGIKDKDIYFLDYSVRRDDYEDLKRNNRSITVLDHHLSVLKDVKFMSQEGIKNVIDINHSGAVLSWQYFFPKEKIPSLLLFIEDFDLWRFKRPFTKALVAYLELKNFDFKEWDRLAKDMEDKKKLKVFIKEGQIILAHKEKVIKDLAEKAKKIIFEGKEILAVNSPVFISEIGNALVKKFPPFSLVWFENGKFIKISLRSDGKFNVAEIAEKYGGGGHRAAAGFYLKKGSSLPWQEKLAQ